MSENVEYNMGKFIVDCTWRKNVSFILSYLNCNIACFVCCMRMFWVGGIHSMVLLFLVYNICLHWFTLLTGHVLSYIQMTNCSMIAWSSSVYLFISDILEKTAEGKIFQWVLNECYNERGHIKKQNLSECYIFMIKLCRNRLLTPKKIIKGNWHFQFLQSKILLQSSISNIPVISHCTVWLETDMMVTYPLKIFTRIPSCNQICKSSILIQIFVIKVDSHKKSEAKTRLLKIAVSTDQSYLFQNKS